MEITKEFVKDQLFPKARKIWEERHDRAFVANQHIFEAFRTEFGRKPDAQETTQINQACTELQAYGCELCRKYQVWCACAC